MLYKEVYFATVTMPNNFWEVVTKCVECTDSFLLKKFITLCDNASVLNDDLTEEKFNELFKQFVFNFGNGIVKMEKTKIQLIYNIETFGNTREITAQLPSEFNNKIIDLSRSNKNEITSSHLVGDTIRTIKFNYIYTPYQETSYVKFEVHKFVKNVELIEVLIQLAVDKLEEVK